MPADQYHWCCVPIIVLGSYLQPMTSEALRAPPMFMMVRNLSEHTTSSRAFSLPIKSSSCSSNGTGKGWKRNTTTGCSLRVLCRTNGRRQHDAKKGRTGGYQDGASLAGGAVREGQDNWTDGCSSWSLSWFVCFFTICRPSGQSRGQPLSEYLMESIGSRGCRLVIEVIQ